MSSPALNPVSEIVRFIAGSQKLARAGRKFAELLGWEAAEDIAADIVTQQRAIRDAAHKAEVYDIEALKAIDTATSAESEGGAAITASEAARIRTFISRSAELDHDASELATV